MLVDTPTQSFLPGYDTYVKTKKQYQQQLIAEDAVIRNMEVLCDELRQLVCTLYSSTDMRKERKLLEECVCSLYDKLAAKNS